MPKLTYSIPEAAKALGVSNQMVYAFISQNRLRAAKIGRAWAIKPEWLDEFIDSCEIKQEAVSA